MKKKSKLLNAVKKAKGVIIEQGEDGFACQLPRPRSLHSLCVIISWGEDWDHISVHGQYGEKTFTPCWDDMMFVKNLFFKPSETVVQFHPRSTICYVNIHENTLHLWRPQKGEIELPPIWMV